MLKRIELFDVCPEDTLFPTTLPEAIAFLQTYLDKVPLELQGSTVFTVRGNGYTRLVGAYMRPETEEELLKRERYQREARHQTEVRERAQLAELKAKYENQDVD